MFQFVVPVVVALMVGLGLGMAVLPLFKLWRATKDSNGGFHLRARPAASTGPALAEAVYQSLGCDLAPGHDVQVFDNGAVFDALVADIGAATQSVHVVIYMWEEGVASDRVTAALAERAHAGVTCRLIVDASGSIDFADTLQPRLTAAGCDVRIFRPLPGVAPLARNHRKLVIVDGAVAFTGGFGFADEWLGDGINGESWRDVAVRFTGPSVRTAQQSFAENWQEAGGGLLPAIGVAACVSGGSVRATFVASTGAPTVTRAERLTQLVIAAACRRLWICNPYFVPTAGVLELLVQQCRAGLDVRILIPGAKTDSKSARAMQGEPIDALLAAGARVWEYQPSMIHAKTMLADDALVVVGSVNLDPLSLRELDEVALLIDDAGMGTGLARSFEADCAHAREFGTPAGSSSP